VETLLTALRNKYKNDKRLGRIDMMAYGNWGEFHEWPWNKGTPSLTSASAKRIVDMNLRLFPNTHIVLNVDNPTALEYSMNVTNRIGLRVDCVGADGMMGGQDALNRVPVSLQRWKTAPFITEWCGNISPKSNLFQQGDNQIQMYHISMLSSGNFQNLIAEYTAVEQAAFFHANKISGYRYVLMSVNIPNPVAVGSSFPVTSLWSNVAIAPTYDVWNVMFSLQDSSESILWQGKSMVDLRQLLPGNHTITDTFQLPPSVVRGSYSLCVTVADPDKYLPPMNLAIGGRKNSGSYSLGTVTVQ